MKLALIYVLVLLSGAVLANPFADPPVVSYSPGPSQWDTWDPVPFHDPSLALGRPYGLNKSVPNNDSVVTLGDGGSITLMFAQPVKDDPANPGGYDFIVFSNATFVGGNQNYRWQELAFVEISPNGTDWYLLLPSKLPSDLIGATGENIGAGDTGHSYTVVRNYAEYTPTLGLPASRLPEEFYCVPDRQSIAGNAALLNIDTVSGGGDAFDIKEAVKRVSPGVPMLDNAGRPVAAGISEFQWIRIADALVGDREGELNEISAEIDAVADVRPAESIGKALARNDGEFTVIKDAVVTAVFPEGTPNPLEIFIQEKDRSAAMRLANTAVLTVSRGDTVIVTGHLSTNNGERVIADPLVTVLSSGVPDKPLGMTNASALKNHAQLVRIWGRVKNIGYDYFVIDDGSGPLTVSCDPSITQPSTGDRVGVTGVMGFYGADKALKVRSQQDIAQF